jgi:Metallo-beta-lactamase superfamily
MSLKFSVGDLTIHRIIEQETTFLPALEMLPGLTPELLAENRAWMQKAGALDAGDVLILCFQSYVVKTPHHTILIDSCIGNEKPRPQRPNWNMKTDETFLRGLAAAGFSVGDIDYVMCTHLHVDHVGWNTRLENGRRFRMPATYSPSASLTTGPGRTPRQPCRPSSIACCRSSKPSGMRS